jgi:hypothetical protein
MTIEKTLVLSTGHAPESEATFGSIRTVEHDHGWIVFVCADAVVPDWFRPILNAALADGCTLVHLDADADEDNRFTLYDW